MHKAAVRRLWKCLLHGVWLDIFNLMVMWTNYHKGEEDIHNDDLNLGMPHSLHAIIVLGKAGGNRWWLVTLDRNL